MYYLGVDSGGTKAAFVLGDEEGRIYARYRGLGCAVLGAGKEGVRKKMEEGVSAVCRTAGIGREEIACMALGISGYGEGEGTERETLEACEEVLGEGRAVCFCDTYAGWAGSFLFEPGINIISGTGAVVYGVNGAGREARSNGWGAGCDEGSCTWHGHKLVEAFTKQADGRMERTKLYGMFRERFGIDGEDAHFVLTLNREVVKGRGLPELQRFLKEICEAGDAAARRIYEEGARELWQGVRAVAEKLGMKPGEYGVSYSGGLFLSGPCILEPLGRLAKADGVRLVPPKLGPDMGALMAAIRHRNPGFDPKSFVPKEEEVSCRDDNA